MGGREGEREGGGREGRREGGREREKGEGGREGERDGWRKRSYQGCIAPHKGSHSVCNTISRM